jgi:hypothetical protein
MHRSITLRPYRDACESVNCVCAPLLALDGGIVRQKAGREEDVARQRRGRGEDVDSQGRGSR